MKNEKHPPGWANRFLEWFCPDEVLEIIQGDLYELYHKRIQKDGRAKARWHFYWDVLSVFKSFAFRKKFQTTNYMGLIKHSFLLFLRTSQRYKSSFFINLIGLSTGLTAAFLIFLWVNDELSIDRNFEKADQIYTILESFSHNGNIETEDFTPVPLAKALKDNFPEVENSTTVLPGTWQRSKGIIKSNEKRLKAFGYYTTSSYFELFPFPIIAGERMDIFKNQQAVAISETTAINLFGSAEKAIGKPLDWDFGDLGGAFYVGSVFQKNNPKIRQDLEIALSLEVFLERKPNNMEWVNSNVKTYVQLKKSTDVAAFNNKIENLSSTKNKRAVGKLSAQAYTDQYLFSRFKDGKPVGGRIDYVRLFSLVAIAILVIACINFMNLSTARASRRMKEIGLKKALGAERRAIIFQCLSESFLMTFISALVATGLIFFSVPYFENITNKTFSFGWSPGFFGLISAILLGTAVIAGSYPAFYLSALRPMSALKGKIDSWSGELWTRQGLVIFQFSLSIVLIVGVIIIYKQIELVQTQNLGFDRTQVVTFNNEGPIENDGSTFIDEIRRIPGVVNATSMYGSLLGGFGSTSAIHWEGKEERISVFNQQVGYDFLATMGIEIIKGRDFSKSFPNDNRKMIVNEAAAKLMGFKNPVGKKVILWENDWEIIGLVKDFHFESLYEDLKPCFLRLTPGGSNYLVKIRPDSEGNTLRQLATVYESYSKGLPMEYTFLDTSYNSFYESELRVATLSRYFALMAILISCLGLFGLSAFTAERRIKEIGIRKVLGASTWGIVQLLSASFTKMVIVSILIGLPLSYWLASNWLEAFAYRVNLEWWYFLVAAFSALMISWLTVGFQTLRAARINPIETLKSE